MHEIPNSSYSCKTYGIMVPLGLWTGTDGVSLGAELPLRIEAGRCSARDNFPHVFYPPGKQTRVRMACPLHANNPGKRYIRRLPGFYSGENFFK